MLEGKLKNMKISGNNKVQLRGFSMWIARCAVTFFFVMLTTTSAAQAENRDEVIYFFNDALGSAVAAVNEAGELCWSENYTPYGDKTINEDAFVLTDSGCGVVGEERGFTGHTEDVNSDLVYMQQRYYDPSIGRFLSIDPLDANPNDPRTYNRYAYGNNNPYKYTDPDGRDATDIYGYNPFPSTRFKDIAVFEIGTSLDANKMAGALIGLSLAAVILKVGEDDTTESDTPESPEDNDSGVATKTKLSGKNPPINRHRQNLHTNGTEGKSQFKDGVDVDNLVHDAWENGTPRFNKNGKLIGKVKQYKDPVGEQGQTSIDTRFSRKHGIHGFPSNKKE